MRVKGLRGFDNQRHVPEAFANHGFPDRGRREKSRERRSIGADGAVRKEEEPRARAAAQRGSRKLSKSAARPRDSSGGRKSDVGQKLGSKNRSSLRKAARGNDRTRGREASVQGGSEGQCEGCA